MRVYGETNFLLEWAFGQEQHASCEALLKEAEAKSGVALAIPAFCFVEASEKLRRNLIDRQEMSQQLDRELRELKRTQHFAYGPAFAQVTTALVDGTQEAQERLEALRERLLRAARILPLDAGVLEGASDFRRRFDLEQPDAVVLASVMRDPELGKEPACFLNRNTKDFDDPEIKAELKARRCRLIGSFEDGLAYVRSSLAKGSSP